MNTSIEEVRDQIALAGLKIGAIKIRPEKPFLWASGTYNPIYNDNRMFLWYPEYRRLIAVGFVIMINNSVENPSDFVIAGTSTSGIPLAERVASCFEAREIYVRDKPKSHGLMNQIEGIDADKDLRGYPVILLEDLISTGGSSVSAVAAIRKANGICNLCISIFNYGLPEPKKMFAGEIAYNKDSYGRPGEKLNKPCEVKSLLYYPKLLQIGLRGGFIKKSQEKILLDWLEDQPNWGEKHGFPPVKK